MSSESRFTKPPGSTSLAKAKREEDLKMLNALLSAIEGVREEDREAFLGMRKALDKWICLTPDQRSWVRGRYEAGVSAGPILPELSKPIPVGKPVVSMVGSLPKKPPPMPQRREYSTGKDEE